ncbi:MAG: hypothetical protein HC851_24870 [Acaryochloris sp. RU_4_1]|nr:hypothetical protein [Acaryochloris sp. RU_4_1]NJR55488.1 hypothetical protein [Acaryochloris sp. CRU_2_0]
MKAEIIPLLTALGVMLAPTHPILASELTDSCLAQAVGSDSNQSSLNIDRAKLIYSKDNYHLLIVRPASSSRMIETLIQDGDTCSVVAIDAPGNGIAFDEYLPPEYASIFDQKSQEFWKSQAPGN